MENHGLGTHNDKLCADTVELEIPQIPYNLSGPSAQVAQWYGIIWKKALITCPLSMGIVTQLLYNKTLDRSL